MSGSDVYTICDIITFAQFEEGNILTKTSNDAESGDEYANESIKMSQQDMDALNSGDESYHSSTQDRSEERRA